MQIQIYRDLEEIKGGGLRQLSKRQWITILISVLTGIPLILLLVFWCHMPVNVACYPALIAIIPIARIGMYNKNGLSYTQHRRLLSQMRRELTYCTYHEERGYHETKGFTKKRRKQD